MTTTDHSKESNFLLFILLLFVAGVPFITFTVLVLRYFYALGAGWGDAGVLASVMWHSDLLLHTPKVAGGASFFETHMTPIFIPISFISRFLPLTKVQFFSVFSGLCAMLPAIAVYWMLVSAYRMNSPLKLIAAAVLSLLFAFNGITLAATRNPHFEMLIIGSSMLFFVAFTQRKTFLAILFFVICLTTREDAGLDLFALIAVATGISLWKGVPLSRKKHLLIFGICGLGYSIGVVILQRTLFPGGDALVRVYLGAPPFSGVSWAEIMNRLAFYAAYRLYIFLPAFVALAWAIRIRNPYIFSGYISFIPWLILNLFATSPFASTLSNYYSFPFILSLFWPLIGLLLESPKTVPPTIAGANPVLVFMLMLLTSFFDVGSQQNPQNINFPESFFVVPTLAQQSATDTAIKSFAQASSALGNVVVDGGIVALDPDHYFQSQLVWATQKKHPDTIIYFSHGQGTKYAIAMAAQAHLQYLYQVPDTTLRVATDRMLTGLDGLIALKSGEQSGG